MLLGRERNRGFSGQRVNGPVVVLRQAGTRVGLLKFANASEAGADAEHVEGGPLLAMEAEVPGRFGPEHQVPPPELVADRTWGHLDLPQRGPGCVDEPLPDL